TTARITGAGAVSRGIVIVGCGGHGREIFGIVTAVDRATTGVPPWEVLGFVDDDPSPTSLERVERLGARFLGPTSRLAGVAAGTRYVLGIGNPAARSAF